MIGKPNFDNYSLEDLFDSYSRIDRKAYPENFEAIKKAIAKKQHGDYKCIKCGCEGYEASKLYAAQDRFESIMDYESGKFVTVSCINCGYTELYKRQSSALGSLMDLFAS